MDHEVSKYYIDWFSELRDDIAVARIAARVDRLMYGHFGDVKPVGESVWEMRVNVGVGYRVYYAIRNGQIVLLLIGGNKSSTQSRDIKKAIELNNVLTDDDIKDLP